MWACIRKEQKWNRCAGNDGNNFLPKICHCSISEYVHYLSEVHANVSVEFNC